MTSLIILRPDLRFKVFLPNHVTNMSVIVGKSAFGNQNAFKALMDKAIIILRQIGIWALTRTNHLYIRTLAVGKNLAWNDREVMCLHIYKCAKIQGAIPSL